MLRNNLKELSVEQEEKGYNLVKEVFESKITDDYWHFSYEGNRLNLKTLKVQLVFEIHSEEGSFNGMIEMNEKETSFLKSSIKFVKL